VLEVLAKEGKLSAYQITEKKAHCTRGLLKSLEQANLVKKFGEYTNEKGVKASLLGLTLDGLVYVFNRSEDLWKYVDNVLSNWKDLEPLVFGNLDALTKSFGREGVLNALRQTFSMLGGAKINPHIKNFLMASFKPFISSSKHASEELFEAIFFYQLLLPYLESEESTKKLRERIREISSLEVKEFLSLYLDLATKSLSDKVKLLESLKKLKMEIDMEIKLKK
jgi:hypothetical protein